MLGFFNTKLIIYFSEIGAEACKSEESNQYVVELTTSTSSPNEIEKMLVEEHNSCPDPMQSTF